MSGLTKPQRELLLDLSDGQQQDIYCNDSYRPAIALVAAGMAFWKRPERLSITSAGRAALEAHHD